VNPALACEREGWKKLFRALFPMKIANVSDKPEQEPPKQSREDIFLKGSPVMSPNGFVELILNRRDSFLVRVETGEGTANLGALGSSAQRTLLKQFPGLKIKPSESRVMRGSRSMPEYYSLTLIFPEDWRPQQKSDYLKRLHHALQTPLY